MEARVEVAFSIGSDGKIRNPLISETTFDNGVFITCILKAFQELQFPPFKAPGGSISVRYPIQFTPEGFSKK